MAGFYAIEASVHRGFLDPVGPADQGWDVAPCLALCQIETGAAADAVIYASDTGYRTRATDPQGVVAYPPTVIEAMQIDVAVNLDPTKSAVAAAWGSLKLANADHLYDAYIAGWQTDGQPITIWRGERTIEAFDGLVSPRPSGAAFLDSDGILKSVGAGVVRRDYTGLLTIDPRRTNFIRNNTMINASVATNTLPLHWSTLTTAALGRQVVAVGTVMADGVALPYVDIRFSGTTANTNIIILAFEDAAAIFNLLPGQVAQASFYAALVGGTLNNISSVAVEQRIVSTSGPHDVAVVPLSPTLTRFSGAWTMQTGDIWEQPTIIFYTTIGVPVDFTVRIAGPQLEIGSSVGPVILTTNAIASIGPGTTNFIRNASASGAVTGTPGTLPTNWFFLSSSGLTTQVAATGTTTIGNISAGYVDIRLSGVATGTFAIMAFESGSQIPTLPGAVVRESYWAAIVGGTTSGITGFTVDIRTTLAARDNTASMLTTDLSLRSFAYTLIAGEVTVTPCIGVFFTNGASIDITIRIAAPQVEFGALPGAMVLTTGAIATTQPTYHTTGIPVPLNEPVTSNLFTTGVGIGGINASISASTEVPAFLSGSTVYKSFRTTTGTDTNTAFATLSPGVGGSTVLTGSVWVWIPSSLAGKTSVALKLEGGVSGTTTGALDLTKTDQWQRVSATATYVSGNVSVVLRVTPQIANDTLYTTCWQLERGSVATSYIAIGGFQATRWADLLYPARGIAIDPAYSSLVRVFSGVMGPWQPDIDMVTIALRDASYYLEKPIARTLYGGTGGADGTASLAGVARPITYGGGSVAAVANVTPLLIDHANLIYDVGLGAFTNAAYDGGVVLVADGQVSTVYSGTPPIAGHFRYDSTGLLQVGSTPVFALTADVWRRTSPAIDQLALAACSDLVAVPPSLVSGFGHGIARMENYGADAVATLAALATKVGLYIASGDTVDGVQVMSTLLDPGGALLVPGRDGKLRLLVLTAIPNGSVAALSLDNTNIVSITRVSLPTAIDPPPWRMRLAWGRNWTQQDTNQLAGGASAAQSTFASAAYRTAVGVSATQNAVAARLNDPDVIAASGGSVDQTAATAQSTVSAMIALWGVQRHLYDVAVPRQIGLTLDWASIVNLTSDFDGLTSPGKLGQIVGWRYSTAEPTATFRVLV